MFIHYKGKYANLTVEKSGKHSFNQIIKATITSNRTYGSHVPSGMRHWEGHNIAPERSLAKMHNVSLHEKIPDKYELRDGLQNNG